MKRIISTLIITSLLGSSLRAQERTDAKSPKDEGTGTLLSVVITGGGHFYAEESGTALILLLVGGGSLIGGAILGSAIPKETDVTFYTTTTTIEEYNWTFFWIGSTVYVGTWIYGIVDAPKAVRRYNHKYGFSHNRINLAPHVSERFGYLTYGVRLSYSIP